MKMFINFLMAICLTLFSLTVGAQSLDINTATAEQLDKTLKGIGPKKAAEIVKYREANGPFKSVEDLAKVPGIGEKTLMANKSLLSVGGSASAVPAVPAMPTTPTMPAVPAVPAKPTLPEAPATPATPAK